ncbi:bpX6 domain-containing protein [Lentzea sp. NPDC004789]
MTTFRGTVTAKAFVLDVHVIGEEEARTRVLDLWQPGARLYATPAGSWLLALAEPVEVRAERAPGLPLTEVPDDVTPLDCAQWTDTSGLVRYGLTPADHEPAPDPVESTVPEAPELRVRGGIGAPSQHVEGLAGGESGATFRTVLIVLGALGVLVLLAHGNFRPVLAMAFIAALAAIGRAARGTAAATRPAAARQRGDFWARLAMRTPLRALVRSKHDRYLRRLTELFERKDWHNALRDAIGIGRDGEGRLSLKVPQRRTGDLRPTTVLGPGAGPFYGVEVQHHLQRLYRTAAEDLERLGRHDEAAFVHADLLGDPAAAVALFERLGRLTDAAELAEGRGLDPALAVRLWWRAGNRTRAIDVARARGAFAAAIARLPEQDGRELRTEWVRERQEAGDHLGAVGAAWPDETTRDLALPSVQAGMALGGPTGSTLFAHLAVGWPTARTHVAALALLDDDDPELAPARRHFVDAWLALQGADRDLFPPRQHLADPEPTPAGPHHTDTRLTGQSADQELSQARQHLTDTRPTPQGAAPEPTPAGPHLADTPLTPQGADRELGSAATRAFVRDGTPVPRALKKLADPLLAADLPKAPRPRRDVPDLVFPALPAQLVVHDAVALRGNAVLVALGDQGTRLLTGDGRTRARWDVPAHQVVIADHGGSALLVGRRGAVCEVHHLDVASRKVRHWTTLAHRAFVGSFDGGIAVVRGPDGLEFLDVRRNRPTAVWRELDRDAVVLGLARNEHSLAVVFTNRGDRAVERWRWELPGLTLRERSRREEQQVLPEGTLLPSGEHCDGTADGDAWWTPREDHAEIRTKGGLAARTTAVVHGIRWHAGLVTLIDHDSRVVALDTETREQVAAFAVAAR